MDRPWWTTKPEWQQRVAFLIGMSGNPGGWWTHRFNTRRTGSYCLICKTFFSDSAAKHGESHLKGVSDETIEAFSAAVQIVGFGTAAAQFFGARL